MPREYSLLGLFVVGVVIAFAILVGPMILHLFRGLSAALALPAP